jgi:23S rRNA pseudouridine1911/1915/1917 synthase
MAKFVVQSLPAPTRLDRLLRQHFPEWGRQAIGRLIEASEVRVNGRTVWLASWLVDNGDSVEIGQTPPAKPSFLANYARFDDAWLLERSLLDDQSRAALQQASILAVNKPAGLLCEPARNPQAANLRDLAIARFGALHLFHRLDRDTSGVVLLTRPGPINQVLTQAFQRRTVQKEYLAVVASPNRLQASGEIRLRIAADPRRRDRMMVVEQGGQFALTRYEILEERKQSQLLRLWPETGRTHQLRLHLAHLGAAILGDRLYGDERCAARLLLHAHRLHLPALGEIDAHSYEAPVPEEFGLG